MVSCTKWLDKASFSFISSDEAKVSIEQQRNRSNFVGRKLRMVELQLHVVLFIVNRMLSWHMQFHVGQVIVLHLAKLIDNQQVWCLFVGVVDSDAVISYRKCCICYVLVVAHLKRNLVWPNRILAIDYDGRLVLSHLAVVVLPIVATVMVVISNGEWEQKFEHYYSIL